MTSGQRSRMQNLTRYCYKGQRGIALVTALLFLLVLTLVGTIAITVSTTDMRIGSNYKATNQAFYDAEAGLQYAIKQIGNGLVSESLTLPGNLGNSVSVSYTVPDGFHFDNSVTLTNVGTNRYRFQIIGRSTSNAGCCTLEAIIKRDSIFKYGVFGNNALDLKSGGYIYSYDSRVNQSPMPWTSTGEGHAASNVAVQADSASYIHGDVALGDYDSGGSVIEAAYSGPTGVVSGTPGADVSRINSDPLGVSGGDLATTFATVSTTNDNSLAGLTGTTITLGTAQSLTLYGKAGGASYYLTGITLNQGGTLRVDTTSGEVNIYLSGLLIANQGSAINMVRIVDGAEQNGRPTDVTIYSNSTDNISFLHGSSVRAAIYAPNASVLMKNSAAAYGLIWSKTATIRNSGSFYFDTALKDKFLTKDICLVSWREVR